MEYEQSGAELGRYSGVNSHRGLRQPRPLLRRSLFPHRATEPDSGVQHQSQQRRLPSARPSGIATHVRTSPSGRNVSPGRRERKSYVTRVFRHERETRSVQRYPETSVLRPIDVRRAVPRRSQDVQSTSFGYDESKFVD